MVILQHRQAASETMPTLVPLPVSSQELGNNMKESGDQAGEQTFGNGRRGTTTSSAEEIPDGSRTPWMCKHMQENNVLVF